MVGDLRVNLVCMFGGVKSFYCLVVLFDLVMEGEDLYIMWLIILKVNYFVYYELLDFDN